MKTKRLEIDWIDEHDNVIATHDQRYLLSEGEKADVIGALLMKRHPPASLWRIREVYIRV